MAKSKDESVPRTDPDPSERDAEEATTEDRINEAGRESFPTSDPPSWTLGVEADDNAGDEERPEED